MATNLTKSGLEGLFKNISVSAEKAYGEYIFEEMKVIVRRKNPLSLSERSKRLYEKRKNAGVCIMCGAKVTKKNPYTGKLYRCCEKHHKLELAKKKAQRTSSKKNTKSKKK